MGVLTIIALGAPTTIEEEVARRAILASACREIMGKGAMIALLTEALGEPGVTGFNIPIGPD